MVCISVLFCVVKKKIGRFRVLLKSADRDCKVKDLRKENVIIQ